MGMVLEAFGRMTIEVRRESFKVHPDYDELAAHPEFMLDDLDDLISALEDARRYVREKRALPPAPTRWPQFVIDAAEKRGTTPESLEAAFQAFLALESESKD